MGFLFCFYSFLAIEMAALGHYWVAAWLSVSLLLQARIAWLDRAQ